MGKAARAVRSGIQADFVKKFEALSGRYSVRQIWEDWVIMSAIAVSNAVDLVHAPEREQRYLERARKYSEKELAVFAELFGDMVNAFEFNPDQDFLGEMYMAVGMGNDKTGQFFTPYDVCKMMAEMNTPEQVFDDLKKQGWISVLDPACGAGALLIAFANTCRSRTNYQKSVLFVAQDIDFLVGCMCYLQLSILGCPGYVKIGDSIADPTTSYDKRGLIPRDDGNIWYTPFYFTQEWNLRRSFAQLDLAFERMKGLPVQADAEASQDAPDEPLQRPELASEPDPPVVITPEQEPPSEAVSETYAVTELGQLTFF